MKIGYDAKRAFLNNTGLGNYSRWFIRSLAVYFPANAYYLYTPKIKPGKLTAFLAGLNNTITQTPASRLFTSMWRSRGVVNNLKRDGIELYHGLSHELPFGINKTGIKSVVTVHDLIVLRFPQYFSRINRFIYTKKLSYACQTADGIIAISQQTKKDMVQLLGISPQKIKVIYQGCHAAFKSMCSAAQKQIVQKKYGLPNKFILNVGTIEPRKNLLLIVKALLHVQHNLPLVVIGKPGKYLMEVNNFISSNSLTSKVIFLNDVAFDDLPAIYQLSAVFVYPSRYEGFGIPVLEALHCGIPVIAATGSCLEEAGGPDSLYVSADDEQLLAGQIDHILGNDSVRQKMISKGREYCANFADDKLAAQTMAYYQNILTHA